MPRYLAQNFLAEAQTHRRVQLERMLVAPPRHIEFLEAYAHKGLAADEGYLLPWRREEGFQCPLSTLEMVKVDLVAMVTSSDGDLEHYSSSLTGERDDSSSLLSQDITAAMQELSGPAQWEGFSREPLQCWEHDLNPECGVLQLLEIPLDCGHSTLLLSAVPVVQELGSRLRPKLLPDPLLQASSGQPYNHSLLFRDDLVFAGGSSEEQSRDQSCDQSHETFAPETLDPDALMELSVVSPDHTHPELDHAPSQLLLDLSPDATIMEDLQEHSAEELNRLVEECPAPPLLPLPPPSSLTHTGLDFVKLNNTVTKATDSPDSGIGHALLESPCLPPHHPHTLTPSPLSPLTVLEPLPLSPEGRLALLSPAAERRLLQSLWTRNKSFDSILALAIPYPDTGCCLCLSEHTVAQVLSSLSPMKLDGDSELELPWDPVAEAYHEMVMADRGLLCKPAEVGSGEGGRWVELFARDISTEVEHDAQDSGSDCTARPAHSKAVPPTAAGGVATTPRADQSVDNQPEQQRERSQATTELADLSLDLFMMLRAGSPRAKPAPPPSPAAAVAGVKNVESVVASVTASVTTPTVCEIALPAEYRSALERLEAVATSLQHELTRFGLKQSSPEAVKFFLRQQQKLLVDAGVGGASPEPLPLRRSCQQAASLLAARSVADALTHGSLSCALRTYAHVLECHAPLLEDGAAEVRETLLRLKMAAGVRVHPKLQELVRVVARWLRGNPRGIPGESQKAVVVVLGREMPGLCEEVLEVLQSLPDAIVSSGSATGELSRRVQECDCVVLPSSSLLSALPWPLVSLLVLYQHPGVSVFPDGCLPAAARLSGYIALQTSASPTVATALQSCSEEPLTLMVSEVVLGNSGLLRLLENRYNITVIGRDYSSLTVAGQPSLSYADVMVGAGCGIVVRPLSLLASDTGWQTIVSTATSLHFQYSSCWILLYCTDKTSYPFGGCVPTNLARLHASVAHFAQTPPTSDQATPTCLQPYLVTVWFAPSVEEAAASVRRIAEHTLRGSKTSSLERGDWLSSDVSKAEQVLLQFPCLSSFSAQLMLRCHSLAELFTLEPAQLDPALSCLPSKVISLFHRMCNAGPTGYCYGNELSAAPTEPPEAIVISDEEVEPRYYGNHPEECSSGFQLEATERDASLQSALAPLYRAEEFDISLPTDRCHDNEEEEGGEGGFSAASFFTTHHTLPAHSKQDQTTFPVPDPAIPWSKPAASRLPWRRQNTAVYDDLSLAPERERAIRLAAVGRVRTPVMALDLGFEEGAAKLRANDRDILAPGHRYTHSNLPQLFSSIGHHDNDGKDSTAGPEQPLHRAAVPERRVKMNSVSELRAFHSKEKEGGGGRTHQLKPAAYKRRCAGRSADSLVPCDGLSSPPTAGVDCSLYASSRSSPAAVLLELSPLRRRKLVCERIPGNEQTQLAFRREL